MLKPTLVACICFLAPHAAPSSLGAKPQNPSDNPSEQAATAKAVTKFGTLSFRQKAIILRTLRRQVDNSGNLAMQRVAELTIDEELPLAKPPEVFRPKKYTPGVPLERVLIRTSRKKHQRVRAQFPVPVFLPDLHRAVHYDWARGEIVRAQDSLSDVDLFENYLHGYAPSSDDALARVLQILDESSKLRKYADWFAHAYCDREGGIYEGITLYQAWYSGKTVEVPDIDAIPFAWNILKKRTYRAPLKGRKRDKLYQAIRDAALKYRIHRSTAEAAAAAFLHAEPEMDGTYARLVPRFHFLFAKHSDDIAHVRTLLRKIGRDKLIAKVDALIKKTDGPAFQVREGRKQELAVMGASLRAAALKALVRFGG